jgi:membrane glycosyltransferase
MSFLSPIFRSRFLPYWIATLVGLALVALVAGCNKQAVISYKLGKSFIFLVPEESEKKYALRIKNDTLYLDGAEFSAMFEVFNNQAAGIISQELLFKKKLKDIGRIQIKDQFTEMGKPLTVQFSRERSDCRTYEYIDSEEISRILHMCILASQNKETTLVYSISFLNKSGAIASKAKAAQDALNWLQLQPE